MASGTAWASAPKDNLAVVANTSTNGVAPTSTADQSGKPEWFYAFCVPSGGTLSDSFVLNFNVTNNPTVTASGSVNFSIEGKVTGDPTLGNTITISSNPVSITDSGSGGTANSTVSINFGPVPDGTYMVNIQWSEPGAPLIIDYDTIHITVVVGGPCNPPGGSCLLTDSSFNALTDCSGADVNTNTGGTFAIVANNKGTIVSTNPGQFYYNQFWSNSTGSSETVTITFNATNLTPQGANSVHALTFNSSGFTQDLTNFDMVNTLGQHCGPSGPCTITVASGDVLWVTWHVAYSNIGTSSTGIAGLSLVCPLVTSTATCSGRNSVSATGTIADSTSGSTLFTCTASACGYLKP